MITVVQLRVNEGRHQTSKLRYNCSYLSYIACHMSHVSKVLYYRSYINEIISGRLKKFILFIKFRHYSGVKFFYYANILPGTIHYSNNVSSIPHKFHLFLFYYIYQVKFELNKYIRITITHEENLWTPMVLDLVYAIVGSVWCK